MKKGGLRKSDPMGGGLPHEAFEHTDEIEKQKPPGKRSSNDAIHGTRKKLGARSFDGFIKKGRNANGATEKVVLRKTWTTGLTPSKYPFQHLAWGVPPERRTPSNFVVWPLRNMPRGDAVYRGPHNKAHSGRDGTRPSPLANRDQFVRCYNSSILR
jgi:hypothetical protein